MDRSDNLAAFDALSKAGIDAARTLLDAFGAAARAAASANPLLNGSTGGCCDIPPACWLPRALGEHTSEACPCGTALVQLRVTNCQPVVSKISVSTRSNSDLEVKVMPSGAELGPMERKRFTVSVSIPQDACKGDSHEILVWVHGCNDYYLRWTVQVAEGSSGSCRNFEVEDCPDYVHHWYDHFYCDRPCWSTQSHGSSDQDRKGRRDDG